MKKDILQDMAVRFTIALIKEEYDFGQCEVMDQIYWFVMFILSATVWFGPRLRHHVYQIAQNCFNVFKPSLLECLEEINRNSEKRTRKFFSFWYNDYTISTLTDYIDSYNELKRYLWKHWYLDNFNPRESTIRFLHSVYEYQTWFWSINNSRSEDLLEDIYEFVLEIMYARLQTDVCEQASAEFQERRNAWKFLQRRTDVPKSFYLVEREKLPKKIADIFKSARVQEEIGALILEAMCSLISKLEPEHARLVKLVRRYERKHNRWDEDKWYSFYYNLYDSVTYEGAQERILSYEVLLNKLIKDSYSIIEDIRNRVLVGLNQIALKQFDEWKNTQEEIEKLKWQSEPCQPHDKSPETGKKKSRRQLYQLFAPKPIMYGHLKHSTGRSK